MATRQRPASVENLTDHFGFSNVNFEYGQCALCSHSGALRMTLSVYCLRIEMNANA